MTSVPGSSSDSDERQGEPPDIREVIHEHVESSSASASSETYLEETRVYRHPEQVTQDDVSPVEPFNSGQFTSEDTQHSSPELYTLQIILGNSSLSDYLTKLDRQHAVTIRNIHHREIYNYIFLLVNQLAAKIETLDPRFNFNVLTTCGSAFDSTKVGKADEFDFIYELTSLSDDKVRSSWEVSGDDVLSLPVSDYDIWCDCITTNNRGHVLDPRLLSQKFTSLINEAMDTVVLPSCLHHGGFSRPRFGGTRKHRFADMLQFIWDCPTATLGSEQLTDHFSMVNLSSRHRKTGSMKATESSFIVTVDLTMVLQSPFSSCNKVVKDLKTHPILSKLYKELTGRTATPLPQLFGNHSVIDNSSLRHVPVSSGIHVIPSVTQGWVLTTAALDHSIMELFSLNSSLKRAIRVCKILRDICLTSERVPTSQPSRNQSPLSFEQKMHHCYQMLTFYGTALPPRTPDLYHTLKEFLQDSSEIIHPDALNQLNEFVTAGCSGNSGFIKYLALRIVASNLQDDSFGDVPHVDPDLVLAILEQMGPQSVGVPHIILEKNRLWPFSLQTYFSTNSYMGDTLLKNWYQKQVELVRVLKSARR